MAHTSSAAIAALALILFVGCTEDERRKGDDDDDGAAGAGAGGAGASGQGGSGATGGGSGGSGACGHTGEPEPASVAGITAAHNEARCAAGADPAIPPLAWSSSLAAVAQAYADQLAAQGCDLVHSGGPYGENLFAGTGSYAGDFVVDAWMSEDTCFTYTTFPDCCSCTCGHLTQVLWRESTGLGCAVSSCSGGSGEVWVCNYDPPGNYLGEMPY
jgi:pathogenesis-related protein 1